MTDATPTIQWLEKIVRLDELHPFEQNPRTITEVQYAKLKASLITDGYHSRIKATQDLRVIGGHQRLKAMRELGFDAVAVLVPDRAIDDETFKRILLSDNHNNGVWDMDLLSNFAELEQLRAVGLHEVMNIPPMPGEENETQPGKNMVCCPKCKEVFPVKGNKANPT